MVIVERALEGACPPVAGEERDAVGVEWYNARKRVARLVTRGGVEVGVRLDDEAARRGLRHGDVLWREGRSAIEVDILPCRCIAARAEGMAQVARLCYEAGNRHAPLFADPGAAQGEGGMSFLLPYDGPLLAALAKLGFDAREAEARLLEENRVGSPAGHAHGHSRGGQEGER